MNNKKQNIFIIFSTAILSLMFYFCIDKIFFGNLNHQYSAVAAYEDSQASSTGILPPDGPTNYTDNKNGTITDNYTKLIWEKCPEGLSGNNCQNGSVTLRNWGKSRTECEDLNFAGMIGWRMPTIKELESIVDTSSTNVAINNNFFKGSDDPYWSYSSPQGYPNNQFIVVFSNGTVYLQGENNTAALRCVHD